MSDQSKLTPKQVIAAIRARARGITAAQASIDGMAEGMKDVRQILHAIGRDGVAIAARDHGFERVIAIASMACNFTDTSLEVAGARTRLEEVAGELGLDLDELPSAEDLNDFETDTDAA